MRSAKHRSKTYHAPRGLSRGLALKGPESLEPRHLLAGDILITEIMASNNSTLFNQAGQTTDWIELFNAGNTTINLGGWHLTDDRDEPMKWEFLPTDPAPGEFPNIELEPGEFLIVFASGDDRRNPNEELHTNFKLSSGGEYLAVVGPDGSVSHEYENFGEQFDDISYGPEQVTLVRDYVSAGARVRLLLPNSAANDPAVSTWTAPSFDDSQWTDRNLGIGYDMDDQFGQFIDVNGDVSEMLGNTSSAYVRTSFDITGDVPELDSLELNVHYDDGFVAYLNGKEVASRNAPEELNWNSTATHEHAGQLESLDFDGFSDTDTQNLLTLNGDASFSGNRLRLTSTIRNTGSASISDAVPFGADYSFSTSFAIDVHTPRNVSPPDADGPGGQGMAFVLQSGDQFDLGNGGSELGLGSLGAPFVAVEFDTVQSGLYDPDNSLPTHIGIDTSSDGNIARVGVPRFNGGGPGKNVRYVWVDYDGFGQRMDVYFSETNEQPDTPTLSTNVNLPGLFPEASALWVGFTGATDFASNIHEVLDWELSTSSSELGLFTETIDITDHIGILQPGHNVLAIHGMNADDNDDDFLLSATLTGERFVTFKDFPKYFETPTPGGPNGAGTGRPARPVTYSMPVGAFDEPFLLEILSPSDTATIRYTDDGTIPDANSQLYSGPLQISETTRIRARAFDEGFAPGIVTTQSFVRLDSSLTKFEGEVFSSNLPIVVIDSFGDEAADSDFVSFHSAVALMYDVGDDGTADLLDEPHFAGPLGIHRRGQTSQDWPKGEYALEFWDESIDYAGAISGPNGPDKDVTFFGLPAESDWVLRGPYSDKTQLNEYIALNLYRELGLEAPRVRLVEAFVNTNGGSVDFATDYRGTYLLLEKIKNNGDDGYIFKQDSDSVGEVDFRTDGHGGPAITLKFHDPATPSQAQLTALTNIVNNAERILYSDEFADPVHGYADYFDVDSFIDHWLITELAKEVEGFRLSEYFFINRDGKIEKGPAWDYNLSFSNANFMEGGQWEGFYGDLLSDAQYHWYGRLFEDANFENQLHDRWFELRATTFLWDNLEGMIDEAVSLLTNDNPNYVPAPGEPSNPISRNYDRWGTVDTYLSPNCFFGSRVLGGSNDPTHCRESPLPLEMSSDGAPDSYDDYIFIMKDFVENRLTWIDSEFGLPPQFGLPGGVVPEGTQVPLTAAAPGKTYFTTNGWDPKQSAIVEEEATLIPVGAMAQVIVPTDNGLIDACSGTIFLPEPERCFMNPSYAVGTHGETRIDGNMGAGFGSYEGINTTMAAGTTSAYLRIPFEVTEDQLNSFVTLKLAARYDDGFTAYLWLNGLNAPIEVAHVNAPGSPRAFPIIPLPHNATATAEHDGTEFVPVDVSSSKSYLSVGTNYLIVQALSADASDLFFDAELAMIYEREGMPDSVVEYTSPITVDRNMIIVARTFDETTNKWSSRARQPYYLNTPPIITELNYNPAEETPEEEAAGFYNNDDFEFVEVMNTGNEPFNLSGVRFTDGIEFAFSDEILAPHERGIIVQNQAAFEFRYGSDFRILGQYNGRLNNNGEHITLIGAFGDPIMDFTYKDDDPWSERADGVGGTLEMIDPVSTPSEKLGKYYSWRGSTEFGGSPGRAGADPSGVVINEVLTHTDPPLTRSDSIELYNSSDQAVDIGGWYLSDTWTNFSKYQIPSGTVLNSGEFLVFDESDFNPNPQTPGPNDFALSGARGDDVWLTIPDDAGGILSFVDNIHFGAALNGESLGRTPNGSGQPAPLARTTLGCANTHPRVGPLLISEFSYNPGDPSDAALSKDSAFVEDDLEFIEVHNPTGDNVDLTHWQLRGGVELNFDRGTILGPRESLVVLSFNPDTPRNANRVAAFRAHYGIAPTVRFVGGWTGQLSDSSETIRLDRPDDPPAEDPTIIPRVVEDMVVYDDRVPWPTEADGKASSLSRRAPTFYGDAVNNWIAAVPSPGSVNFSGNTLGDLTGDGMLDDDDVDVLLDAVRNESSVSYLDLNNSSTVDSADVSFLVENLIGAFLGDANLDGNVTAADLSRLGQHWLRNECVSWNRGDFNGDGAADADDLNILGLNWRQGDAAAAIDNGANRLPRAPLPALQGIPPIERAYAEFDVDSFRRPDVGFSARDLVSRDDLDLARELTSRDDDVLSRGRVGERVMTKYHRRVTEFVGKRTVGDQSQQELVLVSMVDDVLADWKVP